MGFDVDYIEKDFLLLIVVCCYGYLDIVEELIKVRVDVNFKYGKYILLIVICLNGYLDIVVLLIEVGVDVNL